MTAVTFLRSSEEPNTHNIEKSFDGAGWWISTPDFPAVPVPPTAQRAGCWDGSVMQKVCAFSVLVLMLCVWWGLCGAMDERAGLLIQRFRVRVPAEMITWHVPLLFWMLPCYVGNYIYSSLEALGRETEAFCLGILDLLFPLPPSIFILSLFLPSWFSLSSGG